MNGRLRPLALIWHRPDPETGGIDHHPGDGVRINGRSVAADLTIRSR